MSVGARLSAVYRSKFWSMMDNAANFINSKEAILGGLFWRTIMSLLQKKKWPPKRTAALVTIEIQVGCHLQLPWWLWATVITYQRETRCLAVGLFFYKMYVKCKDHQHIHIPHINTLSTTLTPTHTYATYHTHSNTHTSTPPHTSLLARTRLLALRERYM